MKKFFALLLPVLLAGCIVDSPNHDKTTVKAVACPLMASASGTTGTTSYTCERLACDEEAFTFHCSFHNDSQESQPGVTARIGLYSDVTSHEVLHSGTIFAKALQPGETDTKVLRWSKAEVKPVCGQTLEKCIYLVDRIWPQ